MEEYDAAINRAAEGGLHRLSDLMEGSQVEARPSQ